MGVINSIGCILILTVLYQFQTVKFVVATICNEPPAISFEDYIDTVNVQTNSVRPHWYESLDDNEKLPGVVAHNLYLYRNGTNCNHHRRHHRHISSLASCPFKIVDNIDENRFPRRLSQTLCLCRHPSRMHSNNRDSYICQSVVQYVSVFRKDGCSYTRYWEPVPVACVSVAASSLEPTSATSLRILTGA